MLISREALAVRCDHEGCERMVAHRVVDTVHDPDGTAIERVLALSYTPDDALRAAERDGFKIDGEHVFCEKHHCV
ncbi:hypothetical protein [Actinomyces weissii]|uniref:Uncharacterized protein n=1 Tax=Actinomyces weissii TaxID=675090 RepID=A0A7T7MAG2_9ACTO|nr:hypothetical protein [Actinomyces weissii]QQM67899.1 hypothetical protein JG540_03240 [Actinomyces weissii]